MNIRFASMDDCEDIANIHCASFKAASKDILPDDYLNKLTLEVFVSRWKIRLADKTCLTMLAEEKSKIKGFATIINFNCEDDINKEKAELKLFYVHVDYWRKKIGTQIALNLAKFLIEKGYNSISGWALAEDTRSNGFYLSLGAKSDYTTKIWMPIGSTPETYPDGTNADANHYVVNDIKKTLSLFLNKENYLLSAETINPSLTPILKQVGLFPCPTPTVNDNTIKNTERNLHHFSILN